jgi:opacity protein-like surface antigen
VFDQRFTNTLLLAALLIVVLPASSWARPLYYYAQIGPTFGIVDDSFKGDYEDMVGVNARVGGRGEIIGLELHVEALPGSIVRRDEDSKEVGKNITSVTLNTKIFRDFGPLEPYFVAGIGLVTVTQILFVAAAGDEEFDQRDKQDNVSFHARVGVGLHFPVTKHLFGYAEGTWNGGAKGTENYSYLSLTTGIGVRF